MSNISSLGLRNALDLAKNPDYIIGTCDKNLGTFIDSTLNYRTKVHLLLDDTSTYNPISIETAKTLLESARALTFNRVLRTSRISEEFKQAILQRIHPNADIAIPKFYILYKVHKSPVVGRPIAGATKWITNSISAWLDHTLKPLVYSLPTVLKDSTALVRILESTHFPRDCVITTFDVASLYPSIPTEDGLVALQRVLVNHDYPHSLARFIVGLFRIVLTHNIVHFEDQLYHQISGTAMGNIAAVVYANIFLFDLEHNIASDALFYGRFIDDGFFVSNSETSQRILTDLGNQHPNIRLTSETGNQVDFLDLTVYKGPRFAREGKLDIKVFQKPLNKYLYIPPHSFHPRANLKGFIKAECIRYIRNCSSLDAYVSIKNKFVDRLMARGYKFNFIKSAMTSIKYADRVLFLQTPIPFQSPQVLQRPVLISKHSPFSSVISQLLHNRWNSLAIENPDIAAYIGEPMLALKGNPPLRCSFDSYQRPLMYSNITL
jgi:hypothetical protein